MSTPVAPPFALPFPRLRTLLTDDLLDAVRGRAAGYDRDNAFFDEDLAALSEAGYLRALVPTSFGGAGLGLREVAHEQARLAGAAPATALAVNMHHVWTGVARYLHERGDASLDWLLEEAGRGEVFGFGYSEGGNDLVLLGSRTEARPDDAVGGRMSAVEHRGPGLRGPHAHRVPVVEHLDPGVPGDERVHEPRGVVGRRVEPEDAEARPDGTGGYTFHGRKIFTSNSPAWTRLGVHAGELDVKILRPWNV